MSPGYFSLPLALHPGFSGPWRPPADLSSPLATFGCFTFYQVFSSQFYRERYGFEWVFFHPQAFFNLALFPHIFGTFLWLRYGQEHPTQDPPLSLPSQSCPLPTDAWTGTIHILITRPLIYQLRQWPTKHRVKFKLLNMFSLFKVIWKDYKNTLNKTCKKVLIKTASTKLLHKYSSKLFWKSNHPVFYS